MTNEDHNNDAIEAALDSAPGEDAATIERSLAQIDAGEVVPIEDAIADAEAEVETPFPVPMGPAFDGEHSERIRRANHEAVKAKTDRLMMEDRISELKAQLKGLEKAEERANDKLHEIIHGAEADGRQRRLPLVEDDGTAPVETTFEDDVWRFALVEALDIPKRTVTALKKAGITTVGDLEDYRQSQKFLSDIKGISTESAEALLDALTDHLKRTRDKEVFDAAAASPAFTIEDAMAQIGCELKPCRDNPGTNLLEVHDHGGLVRTGLDIAEQWAFYHETKGGGIGHKTTLDEQRKASPGRAAAIKLDAELRPELYPHKNAPGDSGWSPKNLTPEERAAAAIEMR